MKTITLLLATIIICYAIVTPAFAENSEPRIAYSNHFYRGLFGILAHDVGGRWSGTNKEDGADINAEMVFSRPVFAVLSGKVRPNAGISFNTQGDTSKIYAGAIWEIETTPRFFFNTGIGLALHNGELDTSDSDKKSLGTRLLFRIPFEFGYQLTRHHSLSLMFDHISNAYLASENEGMDTLGLRYGYRF